MSKHLNPELCNKLAYDVDVDSLNPEPYNKLAYDVDV